MTLEMSSVTLTLRMEFDGSRCGTRNRVLCGVGPGEEEGSGEAFDEGGARGDRELDAADASEVRAGGLLADVCVLEIGAEDETDGEGERRGDGGLRTGGQVDMQEASRRGVFDDIGGVVGFVEKELLGSRHAAGHHGCGGAVGGGEGHFDEVAAALGDVGVKAVNAHLYIFGFVVAGADDIVAAGNVVGDPLDGDVVTVVENFDLGEVALGGVNGEGVPLTSLLVASLLPSIGVDA